MSSEELNSTLNLNSSDSMNWYICLRAPFYMFVVSEMGNTLLGLSTNIWALVVILSDWRKHGAQEIFTINLAVMEILYCLLSQWLLFNYLGLKLISIRTFTWFVYSLNYYGRSLFQSGLCLERYMAVVHPVFYFKHHFLKCKVVFLIVCWIVTLKLSFGSITEPDMYRVGGLFGITVSVNLFCCCSIFHALRRPGPGTDGKKVCNVNLMKKRASHTVLIILACVILNFIPLFINPTLKVFISIEAYKCIFLPLGTSCCVMGCFVQPLLFLHRTGKLSQLKNLLNNWYNK